MSKKVEKKEATTEQAKLAKKDVELFINRKLAVLNAKSGAKYTRAASRLVAKNLGAMKDE